MVGYSHDIHTPIVPVNISCKPSLYCSFQSARLNKTDDYYFSYLRLFIQHFLYSKIWPVAMMSEVCTNLISPCFMTQVCAIFSNWMFLSILWSNQEHYKTCNILGFYTTSLVNNSSSGSHQ